MEGKNILVMYSNTNVKGKRDATGAFIPEAKRFAAHHEVPDENMIGIRCPGVPSKKRFEEVCMELRNRSEIQWIALFCHGYSNGMQFGMSKKNIPQLVQYMKMSCSDDVRMTLYACSTASTSKKTRQRSAPGTDNGYADKLRDEMLRCGFRGGWIDAHLTPGHTTENPFVMRFYSEPRFENDWDLPGGEWLVSPKSSIWKQWKRCVQHEKSMFRYRFTMYTEYQLYEFLAALERGEE